ncbi:hypothetical protein QBC38DRAFT_477014 [Podospora fimiseda]|uniref:Uncharacterized protein n=1 Tax=Podospora fimiseda TaxID=252190 RepID=A0AAN7BQW1_9PEZI|nr:hypothetical protein QBC38DRAFT_477014 [Podospora fimiseda]
MKYSVILLSLAAAIVSAQGEGLEKVEVTSVTPSVPTTTEGGARFSISATAGFKIDIPGGTFNNPFDDSDSDSDDEDDKKSGASDVLARGSMMGYVVAGVVGAGAIAIL